MSASVELQLSEFALDVAEGLSLPGQKKLQPRYFYDDLGSTLFEAITLLPEYGLMRADERILRRHARDIASAVGPLKLVAELGSGSGRKTAPVLHALREGSPGFDPFLYRPIDISETALISCDKELSNTAEVKIVCADWLDGLAEVARERNSISPLLLLFLGSSIGNLDRSSIVEFLERVRSLLLPGDFFLLGADLVKDRERMIAAYDDALGVTAAFNLNLLSRMNRELGANFDLREFAHQARWNEAGRRIEMHLLAKRRQRVFINCLEMAFQFTAGETIWTESSHKFTEDELRSYAWGSGFRPVESWTDLEWPFTEMLWRAEP
ncbi:MAG TPA: L-histidine N(alpha)-methyltransferase [Bryobacteraceae bacterium]|jgi:dimethylhistidine N-methyltransferase